MTDGAGRFGGVVHTDEAAERDLDRGDCIAVATRAMLALAKG